MLLYVNINFFCSVSEYVLWISQSIDKIIISSTVEREIFARFIFRVLRDLTEFVKVYPANLLISQYKRIIPARKSRN